MDYNEKTRTGSNIQVWLVGRDEQALLRTFWYPNATPHLVQPQRLLAEGGSPSGRARGKEYRSQGFCYGYAKLEIHGRLPLWVPQIDVLQS